MEKRQFYYKQLPSLFNEVFNNELNFNLSTDNPSINYDIIENDDEYIIDLMLSGFDKKDISIKIEKDSLDISGERKGDEKTKYNRKGTFFGKFGKSFTLPENIQKDNINASFNNGMLTIKIPKEKKLKLSKVIEIS